MGVAYIDRMHRRTKSLIATTTTSIATYVGKHYLEEVRGAVKITATIGAMLAESLGVAPQLAVTDDSDAGRSKFGFELFQDELLPMAFFPCQDEEGALFRYRRQGICEGPMEETSTE